MSNNQAVFRFPNAHLYKHDGLTFRSEEEIPVYEELKRRRVLFSPLPALVMGDIRREPDFLIMDKGRLGILEVHGDRWHPPEQFVREAMRRRLFLAKGVHAYEPFPVSACLVDPEAVVDEFLSILCDRHGG